jgi:hypothetical protein
MHRVPSHVRAVVRGSPAAVAEHQQMVLLAHFFMPQIFFFGMDSLLGAILNTKGRFGANMWTPVINNVVVITLVGSYIATPRRPFRPGEHGRTSQGAGGYPTSGRPPWSGREQQLPLATPVKARVAVTNEPPTAPVRARATARPDVPFTPAAGQLAAPMSQTPGTAVR